MKNHLKTFSLTLIISLVFFSSIVKAQDPNFHIYLCFGQSNMEGQGRIEAQDKLVDERFQVMEAIDCSNLDRTKGSWYTAVPPLTRCSTGLTPIDFFGKTMVANLPDSIKVGIINVSVAGCKIELFDKDNYLDYIPTVESWMKNIIEEYEGNPYARLVELAQLAQKDGVIKGILFHQGESNTGESQWPSKVKGVYDNLIADLNLSAQTIPFLAGEMVNSDQGGLCASMNTIIAKLPQSIDNAYVISSKACTAADDNVHFNAAGYRELGRRYAVKMLELLNVTVKYGVGSQSVYFEPECATVGENWEIIADNLASNQNYVIVKADVENRLDAPTNNTGAIAIPFSVNTLASYDLFARLKCVDEKNALWYKIDDGNYTLLDDITSNGWSWIKIASPNLSEGEHTLYIANCEGLIKFDKLNINNFLTVPSKMGEDAENACEIHPVSINNTETINAYKLGQNYPNPFNGKTTIRFELPNSSIISLKVFNMLGSEMVELAGKEYPAGKHSVAFDSGKLPAGYYLYTLNSEYFSASRKMIITSK